MPNTNSEFFLWYLWYIFICLKYYIQIVNLTSEKNELELRFYKNVIKNKKTPLSLVSFSVIRKIVKMIKLEIWAQLGFCSTEKFWKNELLYLPYSLRVLNCQYFYRIIIKIKKIVVKNKIKKEKKSQKCLRNTKQGNQRLFNQTSMI